LLILLRHVAAADISLPLFRAIDAERYAAHIVIIAMIMLLLSMPLRFATPRCR